MNRVVSINLLFCIFSIYIHAQDGIDLDLLSNDWAISYNESIDNDLILRNVIDKEFLNEEDRKVSYTFRISNDSIICENKFPRKKAFVCPVGSSIKIDTIPNYNYEIREVWFLNHKKNWLTYGICSESGSNKMNCVYKADYKIDELQKDYLKLVLLKEIVGGE